MERFFDSIEKALENQDWYGALSTSLTIPDICGKLEHPELKVGPRYKRWYNEWLAHKYTAQVGPRREVHTFLSDEDCYGLRCSYLHEGGGELEDKAKHSLEKFHFIIPPSWGECHNNRINNVLQLQIDRFCEDVVRSGRDWAIWISANKPEVADKMSNLLTIHSAEEGIPGMVRVVR